jgi:hypothetical protein
VQSTGGAVRKNKRNVTKAMNSKIKAETYLTANFIFIGNKVDEMLKCDGSIIWRSCE